MARKYVFSIGPRNDRRVWLIVVLLIALVAAGTFAFLRFRSQPTEDIAPTTQEAGEENDEGVIEIPDPNPTKIQCDRNGGLYASLPDETFVCADRTDDGGRACEDGTECQGECLAQDDSETTGKGTCSIFDRVFDDPPLVANGGVTDAKSE